MSRVTITVIIVFNVSSSIEVMWFASEMMNDEFERMSKIGVVIVGSLFRGFVLDLLTFAILWL